MLKYLRWLDNNIISILAGFLLVFIPLYPKFPLFDILPGYIVRVRLEDFIVAVTIGLWVIWLLRGKFNLTFTPQVRLIFIYLLVGILSMFSAVFLLKTVPLQAIHVEKMILHFLRRVEYFSLFFIFFTTIKSLRQLKIYLVLIVATMIGVVLYGYGQKYLYWPAFSTMNREFSKGWALYLSPHARVLSTFGGHYDLAAFTMMIMIILWSLIISLKKPVWKILTILLLAGSLWLLILTASRASFVAYLIGITVVSFFWTFKIGVKKSLFSWIAVVIFSLLVMFAFGDLSQRFTKFLKLDQRLGGITSLLTNPLGEPPQSNQAVFLENNENSIAAVTSSSDQPPSPLGSQNKPVDVTNNPPLLIPVPGSSTLSAVPRTYSRNALVYDLSTGIRLDSLWPHAIKGFLREPLLGSGYSTLNKNQPSDFTEAESTDNDYLRALGETGILGFITFYGIMAISIIAIWRSFSGVRDTLFLSLLVGLAGLTFGLLANAVLIDVFESSKVAFSFWAITGMTFGGLKIMKQDIDRNKQAVSFRGYKTFALSSIKWLLKAIRSEIFLFLLLLLTAFILRLYKIDAPLADWHSWRQADTSAVTRNYVRQGINILYPTYDDLSNTASGKDNPRGLRFVEFPIYNVLSVITDKLQIGNSVEFSGRFTTIIISLVSLILLYKLVKKYLGKKTAFISALFFAILPYNIYYSRVILPEPLLVMSSLGLLYSFDKWVENDKVKYFVYASLFGIIALLVKPTAAFMIFPILYLAYKKYKLAALLRPQFYLLAIIVVIPFFLWRYWINHYPEGIPAFTWLLNGDGIRFKGAFFYWLFADRLGRLILGYWGLALLFLGFLEKPKKGGYIFHWYAFGALAYLTAVATGNVRHDYYQIYIIPVVVIFLAKGINFLLETGENMIAKQFRAAAIIIAVIAMESFGWYFVRDYFNINHPEIVEAGRAVDQLTPGHSLVVAPYGGDTAFLYQTGRKGWPIMEGSIDELIKKGADYYVSVTFDDTTKKLLMQTSDLNPRTGKFRLIRLTDKYVIIQLVPNYALPRD